MRKVISVSAESYAALLSLLDIYRNQGAESFAAPFRALCQRYEWDWFGLEPKKLFRFHAESLVIGYCRAEHARERIAQIREGPPKWWVLKCWDDCPMDQRGFNGLVLPPDHPFWRLFLPPHGWRCGCSVYPANSEAAAVRLGGDLDRALPEGWDFIERETGLPPGVEEPWGNLEPPSVDLLLVAIVEGHSPQPAFE